MDLKLRKCSRESLSIAKKQDMLFYIAFFTMVFAKAFGLNSTDRSYLILFAAAAVLLVIRILISTKNLGTFIRIGLMLAPGAIGFLHNRETTFLFTCLFLAASKDVDFEVSMKGALGIYLLAIPLRILLYFCGVVEGGYKEIYLHNSAGESYVADVTYGYGYPHPNTLFAVVFIAALLLFYVKKDKLHLWELGFTMACVVAVFCLTKCKTGAIISAAVWFMLLIVRYLPKYTWLVTLGCVGMILVSLIVGAILPALYSPDIPILYFINGNILTGRLHWAREALDAVGVGFLGNGNLFVDSLYIDTLISSGVLGFTVLLAGMTALPVAFYKRRNQYGLICAAAMILYACMEQFPLNIAMNPFLLYLGTNVLFRPKEIKEKQIE